MIVYDDDLHSLLSWAKRHGAHVHDSVIFTRDDTSGICLRTRKDTAPVSAGSQLVTCPYMLSISYLNALDTPLFPSRCETFPGSFLEGFPKETVMVFFLTQQYLRNEHSFWWPYIRCLPQPDEPDRLGTPLHFSSEDLLWLKGTNLEKAASDRKEAWKTLFLDARTHLETCGWDVRRYTWCVDQLSQCLWSIFSETH